MNITDFSDDLSAEPSAIGAATSRSVALVSGRIASVLLSLAVLAFAPMQGRAQVACTPDPGYTVCRAYTHTGGDQIFTVPAEVTRINVKAWGGGGGGSTAGSSIGAPGGSGGYVEGVLSVTPGSQYVIVTGGGGGADGTPGASAACNAAYGFGGRCPPIRGANYVDGGGGGGLSGLFTGSATVSATDNGRAVFVAGGGGSGEGSSACGNASAAGGAGGNAFAGTMSTMQGVHGAFNAGTIGSDPTGGGGGYLGGGGTDRLRNGTCISSANGGSNFITGTDVSDAVDLAGSEAPSVPDLTVKNPPNTTAPQYIAGVGVGQLTLGQPGGNGLVVVQWSEEADLAITKDDGQTAYTPGGTVVYDIVVTNNGPLDVLDAQISDPLPDGIADASWTCADDGGGSACGAASGTGAIATTADLPAGASVTYTLSMTVPIGFGGDLTNTATVDVPAGVTDSDLANNADSDTNTPFTSPPGPDPSVCNIADNGSFESPNIQTDPEGPGDNTAYVNGFAIWRTGTTPIDGWETTSGTRDILRHYNNASEGVQSIDLYGVSAATLRQTFTGLVPGGQYTFSVDYSGHSTADSAGIVQLGNGMGAAPVTLATLRPAANSISNGNAGIPATPSYSVTWSTFRHTFVASGTEATVQFVNTGVYGGTGLFIDNFSFAGDPCADLGIVKTVAPEEARSGEAVVYTLQVTNDGPDAADGAIVTDPGVPDSLECTALTCAAGSGAACPAGTTPAQLAAGLAIPTFPTGGTVTLELTCTVTATGL